jgi:hypothetical protein
MRIFPIFRTIERRSRASQLAKPMPQPADSHNMLISKQDARIRGWQRLANGHESVAEWPS